MSAPQGMGGHEFDPECYQKSSKMILAARHLALKTCGIELELVNPVWE